MSSDKRRKPHDVAGKYVTENPHMIFWRDELYRWNEKHYELMSALPLRIHRRLMADGAGESNQFVSNVVSQIHALCLIDQSLSLPCWKPGKERGEVIPFANGLYKVETGELLEHTPDYHSLFSLPFDYDPAATCPQWLEFLAEIFSGDVERIALLQEWFGYCLMADCRYEKFLLKLGPTRSGKGTVDKILRDLLGDGCGGYSLGHLADTFGLSSLIGKRVALIGEAHLEGRHNRVEILEKLKSIVGGDIQVIQRKFREPIHASLPVKISITANQVPALYDCSTALSARMLLLQFDHSFAGREDNRLADRLRTELPGIANWALAGRQRLLKANGFTRPASSEAAEEEMLRESSVALAFARDCLEVEPGIVPSDRFKLQTAPGELDVNVDSVAKRYGQWKYDSNVAGPEFPYFARQLGALLPKLSRHRRQNANQRTYFYRGIRLKQE